MKEIKSKILVPHNEFMKLFFVSSVNVQTSKNERYPIQATMKIGKNLELRFLVEKEEMERRQKKEFQEFQIAIKKKNQKQIAEKKKDSIFIQAGLIEDANSRLQYVFNRFAEEYILFDRQSYLLYCILFDYYYNNQEKLDNGYLVISFKEIHQMYRGKTLKHFGAIDETTFQSYQQGFEDLHKKKILINLQNIQDEEKPKSRQYIKDFPKANINQNLIEYQFLKNDKDKIVSIKYSLGDLGKLILDSQRMSTIIPVELMRVSYKQITQFYLGMYLSRLVFMNRKSCEYKNVSIKCILENIMCFNTNGNKKGMTKYAEIKTAKQKTKLIYNFEQQLRYILDLFRQEKIIKEYKISVEKITGRNFDSDNTRITLFFK